MASAMTRADSYRRAGVRARPRRTIASVFAVHSAHDLARTTHVAAHDLAVDLPLVGPVEEARPGEHLPEDDRGAEDVGAPIDLAALELLGRHVGQLAFELSLARHLRPSHRLRHAEVDEVREAVGADEDVVRRHVAVHQAERLALLVARLVRGVEPVQHVHHDRRGNGQGGTSRCAPTRHGAGERASRPARTPSRRRARPRSRRRRASTRRWGAGCARPAAPRRGTSRRTPDCAPGAGAAA